MIYSYSKSHIIQNSSHITTCVCVEDRKDIIMWIQVAQLYENINSTTTPRPQHHDHNTHTHTTTTTTAWKHHEHKNSTTSTHTSCAREQHVHNNITTTTPWGRHEHTHHEHESSTRINAHPSCMGQSVVQGGFPTGGKEGGGTRVWQKFHGQ